MPRKIIDLASALDVSASWLAFGMEEIDALSEESLRIAIAFEQLPPEQRELIRAFIDSVKQTK